MCDGNVAELRGVSHWGRTNNGKPGECPKGGIHEPIDVPVIGFLRVACMKCGLIGECSD